MKILFCANIYESGIVGPARLAEMLLKINDLYAGEHELRILTADVIKEEKLIYRMGVRYPKYLRFFDFIFRGLSFYKTIVLIQKDYNFDILVFGNAMYGILAKMMLKKRIVVGFINDDHTVAVGIKNMFFTEGGLSLYFYTFIEKWSIRKLDLIIVCSKYLKRRLVKAYQVPADKIFKLYQSVNVTGIPFRPRHFDLACSIKVLFVKHRYDLGRLEDVAQALLILEEYNFEITVVGPELYSSQEIESFFNGISNVQLFFLGPVSQIRVHELMANHHILSMPATLEAQGLANVEGMAHGISVVSSRTGGIPEVLDNGNNGWLCETSNPVSLAKAIRDCIMTNEDERMAKLVRARKFAEEHFDGPVMLENLLDLLSNITNKKNAHAE